MPSSPGQGGLNRLSRPDRTGLVETVPGVEHLQPHAPVSPIQYDEGMCSFGRIDRHAICSRWERLVREV